MMIIKKIIFFLKHVCALIQDVLFADVYLAISPAKVLKHKHTNAIVFFPYHPNCLCCGLAGIVSFHRKRNTQQSIDIDFLDGTLQKIEENGLLTCKKNGYDYESFYLGGNQLIDAFSSRICLLKTVDFFYNIFISSEIRKHMSDITHRLQRVIDVETKLLSDVLGKLKTSEVETITHCIEKIKDISWALSSEILGNILKVEQLHSGTYGSTDFHSVAILQQANAILNSIDYLEVRGRDSAGISFMFILDKNEYNNFMAEMVNNNLVHEFNQRTDKETLANRGISLNEIPDSSGNINTTVNIAYKIAAEIGSLGDNTSFLRSQIKNDPVFQILIDFPFKFYTISSHTRWASIGAITEPNCHPVDNKKASDSLPKKSIIHVCLNGDIDNYLDLKNKFKKEGIIIPENISTDTKVIPLTIEKYLNKGKDIVEAFRMAVNDFEGSHAISMHTDLAPGKLFLAQKGSGQAIFVGLAEDMYMTSSEIYGFVEETSDYLKLDGEKIVKGKKGKTQGQIYILNQDTRGGAKGVAAMYYDGTVVKISKKDIKHTEIKSRDIDRQGFDHYFLKEISEAPCSVAKTLLNRWKLKQNYSSQYELALDEKTFPNDIITALADDKTNKKQIKRVFFIGQGTAGVAAIVCSDILKYYMNDPFFYSCALKASEFSGFSLNSFDTSDSMEDSLVIAISQSGTTTDTNRAVDMVRKRGAHTIAIVNRRDSDLSFKADGVMYTSTGRDIEMSVASTKAFYSQIVAGAMLSLKIAVLKGRRNSKFESQEIKRLLEIPEHMKKILDMKKEIETCAKKLALTKTYWAVVGSGHNKAAADEIRIKLSELCYKTISSDYIEDKKHIDLSAEPLIIVCAAGSRPEIMEDIVKDTAIFHAHKAEPIVIANEGENRFDPYAEHVFRVPVVNEHLAPVLNTLVGHIWGYYAALSINDGSRFLYKFREDIEHTIEDYEHKGYTIYDIILEESFKEKLARFSREFRIKKKEDGFLVTDTTTDLILILKYLLGKLPVSDFEIDFGQKGTALNMLNCLFNSLGKLISLIARPVDAIKHQAKTVTVGTSRKIVETIRGYLFDVLETYHVQISQISTRNILVLKNLQEIVSRINGAILYRISGLNILGEPTSETTIKVIKKDGVLASIPSRVEKDFILKGSKKIIVQQGNIYVGMGRKDDRSFMVIPVFSASSDETSMIKYLLLLNISFKEDVSLQAKIKALGGKFDHIKNIVMENNIQWDDAYIELVEMRRLFGKSAEKIGESIVASLN
jgi:glucosamine--fructose-6-phosphate aminotransferase (isomerizing)